MPLFRFYNERQKKHQPVRRSTDHQSGARVGNIPGVQVVEHEPEVTTPLHGSCSEYGSRMEEFPNERWNCCDFSQALHGFSDFINELQLLDFPLKGDPFSWGNNEDKPSLSCIDCFLASIAREKHFLDAVQRLISQLVSDPHPILLDCGASSRGKCEFIFENVWLQVPGFVDKVQSWWEMYRFMGSSSFVLFMKLNQLKGDLKTWNKEIFGEIGLQKSRALCELSWLELKEESGLNDEEIRTRDELKIGIEKIVQVEEMSWRQNSRTHCLKEGDGNTKSFYRLSNSHRQAKYIGSLKVDGLMLMEESEIKDGIVAFYKNLYKETVETRLKMDGFEFSTLGEEDREWLERVFEEDECFQS
ncbi:uncharacterized protein LOC115961321 [Quercus lobata]|uniref:uncharacterized protein LOC115961321 n=1 Tax=Quercus lobata TaxID=97700 RepID=UPI001243BA5F|nr:uncharacterized protein LOC115961321 [Quercus lobata]